MKNREQIRARNALIGSHEPIPGPEGGEVVKKIPTLIMNHGLLAVNALAFEKNNEGIKKVMILIAVHLADKNIRLLPKEYTKDEEGLMKYLTDAEAPKLKLVTAEAMAWLNYARRFFKKDK